MNLSLQGRTALVTGAAQGLGRTIALSLAQAGANVALADLDLQKAQSVSKEIEELGGESLAVEVDVSRAQDLDKLVDIVIGHFGRIDILVNNAGICPRTMFEEITEEEWDSVLAINLKSAFLLSQKVFPYMKQNRYGKIVNMASAAGKIGGAQVGAHYSASKAGIICLTKSTALAGAQFGINVNAVCPGVIGTEMTTAISKEQLQNYNNSGL